jgi:hypothetical protein
MSSQSDYTPRKRVFGTRWIKGGVNYLKYPDITTIFTCTSRRDGSSVMAADLPEILKKLNIWIKVSLGNMRVFLKNNMNKRILNSNILDGLQALRRHSGLRPTQTQRGGFSTAKPTGGSQLGPRAECSHCSPHSVSRNTSCICLPFLTLQRLPFW